MNNWEYRDALIRDDGTVLIVEEDTSPTNGNNYRVIEAGAASATTAPDEVGREQHR